MNWKDIVERLKSPVVIGQIISIIVGIIIYFAPQFSDAVKVVSEGILAIINIFAGLNNPTNKDGF